MAINTDKLNEFLGRFVGDLAATMAAGNVVIGHRLGLYRALASGPARAGELAERTQTSPRYIEEWLRGQAAGGYVDYDPGTQTQNSGSDRCFAGLSWASAKLVDVRKEGKRQAWHKTG